MREIARQSPELSKIISNAGGEQSLVEYITDTKGPARFPGISTLGFIAGFDEQMALGIITSKGIEPLKDALLNEKESTIREAAAWTLGRIGKHSGQHARSMAEKDILSILLRVTHHFFPSLPFP